MAEEARLAEEAFLTAIDWSAYTSAQLRAELRSRGLPTSGKKNELVALLEQSDTADNQSETKTRRAALFVLMSEGSATDIPLSGIPSEEEKSALTEELSGNSGVLIEAEQEGNRPE